MSTSTANAHPSEGTDSDIAPSGSMPAVVDLGKQRRRRVKQLRRGEGKLMGEVNRAVDELRAAGTIASNAQAVVFVVRQKRRGLKSLFPRI